MNTWPTADIINIEKNISKRSAGTTESMPLISLSHAELRQLLSTQLQSSLEIKEILAMFFQTTQRLISYDSLIYKHAGHAVAAELGVNKKHSVTYNLNYQGEYLGDISFTREDMFSEDELGDFESIIASLIFPLRNALLYTAALQSALKDPLTGIGNRVAMQQTLQRDIDTAQRHEQALSVLMIDIDYFKYVNDTYGHSAGDTVLEKVAQHIQKQLRTTDAMFRYGGEEFLVVMPNTCSEHANLVAERLRDSLVSLQAKHEEHVISVTASIGCTTLRNEDSQQKLLQRADVALYAAKNNGRNQVQLAL